MSKFSSRIEGGSDFAIRRAATQSRAAQPILQADDWLGDAKEGAVPVPTTQNAAPPSPAEQPSGMPEIVAADLSALGYTDDEIAEIAEGRWMPPVQGKSVASGVVEKLVSQFGTPNSSADVDGAGEYRGFPLESVVGSVLSSFTKKAKG